MITGEGNFGEVADRELEIEAEIKVEAQMAPEPEFTPKIEAQRERLLENLNAANFSTTLARVAGVLNMYPDTRNSDVSLALMYWDIYQPDLFDYGGILPKNLFKLERMTNITRARAKIQNEFRLFQATADVQRGRKGRELAMHEEVLENPAPTPSIWIFADETGKNGDWLIVGSIWVLNPKSVWDLTRAIDTWKETSLWKNREVHFTRLGRQDLDPLREYLNIVTQHREFLGIKYAAVQRQGLRRTTEDAVLKLHELMLVDGLKHELETQRVQLPRYLNVTIDEEDSLDKLALREAKERVNRTLKDEFGEECRVDSFDSVSSKRSTLIQLADIVSGAVNRRLNATDGVRNHKDEMADLIFNSLAIFVDRNNVREFDATKILYA